jgi:MFS family permease
MVSLLGTWMQMTAQGWFVQDLATREFGAQSAAFYVSRVSLVGSLPMFLFCLWAGVLADRVSKRRILIVSQAGLMVASLALGLATRWSGIQLWHVALIAALAGTASAVDIPTRQSYVKEMVGRADMANAIALNSTVFNGARIVAPLLAGPLLAAAWAGPSGVFLLNSVSYLAVIGGLLLIRTAPMVVAPMDNGVVGHLREGIAYVVRHPVLRVLMLAMAIFSVFGFSYMVLMPVMARQVLGVQAMGYTYLISAAGCGAITGALTVAVLGGRTRKGPLMLCGGALFGVALVAFSASRWLPVSLALIAVASSGLMVTSACINTLIQEASPDHLRGRIVSIWAFLFAGFTPLGALYVGAVAHGWGVSGTFAVSGTICVLAVLGIAVLAPRIRTLP